MTQGLMQNSDSTILAFIKNNNDVPEKVAYSCTPALPVAPATLGLE